MKKAVIYKNQKKKPDCFFNSIQIIMSNIIKFIRTFLLL